MLQKAHQKIMITFEEIPKIVSNLCIECSKIIQTLEDLKKNWEPKKPTEYLTTEEVASLLKCDISTIYNWRKKGIIFSYGIGNRTLFKRSEIDSNILPLDKKIRGGKRND